MSTPIALPVPEGPPLTALAEALSEERWPLLFDSGLQRSELARWQLLLFDPVERLLRRARPGQDALREVGAALERRWPSARHAALPDPLRSRQDDSSLPAFRGGAAGWLGYDLGRELERLPERCAPDAGVPDLCLGLYPFALAEELGTGRRLIVGRGTAEEAADFGHAVAALAQQARPVAARQASLRTTARSSLSGQAGAGQERAALGRQAAGLRSSWTRAEYLAAVAQARELILDGAIYQVNLCQRLELPFAGTASALHAALRVRFPAPFGALLRVPGCAVVSSSPELFLRRRGQRVESRPIKGTRPRHVDPARDAALRAELEASAKERAELAMIVDLVRNDLGRTACIGSVAVEGEFRTEAWSTVYHRVATISARVPEGTPTMDIVAAAFPPASVTGTPKLAAQAVIETLEPVRRHVYTGAIGWIGADGDCDLSVAIRIATLTEGRLLASFGGGITLASEPAAEYEESWHKARALCDVLGVKLPLPEESA